MSEYPIKQVIVMRRDLNMRRGKEVAQGAHAAMMFLADQRPLTAVETRWLTGQMAKICVRVKSEAELMDVGIQAHNAGLTVKVVTDAGHTEFNGVPTRTCLAIGPDLVEKIDAITRDLKLY
jgi:peptidyl-tRNA hydrolase, PTH2 family